MYEEFAYAEDGSFLSGTFADYLVATAAEMPKLEILHPVQSPSPFTRLGAKGIAEGNQYSTPVCLANAVADALGRSDITVPLKPAKILEWMAAEEPPSRDDGCAAASKLARDSAGEGSAVVPASPQAVWSALLDENKLRQAIPGCQRLERVGENAFKAAVILGVGPVTGQFEADVGLCDLDRAALGCIEGQSVGSARRRCRAPAA